MKIHLWNGRSLLRRPRQSWADATVMLGGGGARGLAHLGAIRALGHSGIGIRRVVGVSMGALMAALVAVERDVERAEILSLDFLTSTRYRAMQQKVMGAASGTTGEDETDAKWAKRWRNLIWATKAIGRAASKQSLMTGHVLEQIVEELLPDINIEDLSKPLFIIAVDLDSGQRVVISKGSVRKAVVASMSIPGVFPSVEFDGRQLSDVGVYDAVPCDVARQIMESDSKCPEDDSAEMMKGELIVVDVSQVMPKATSCRTALSSIMRVQELAEWRLRQQQLELADLVVRPNVGEIPWFDFTDPEPIIAAGYEAMQSALKSQAEQTNVAEPPAGPIVPMALPTIGLPIPSDGASAT